MNRVGRSDRLVRIRAAVDADMEAITRIYAHHVLTGSASFEATPPTIDEMRRRHGDVLAHGMPYLVACLDGSAGDVGDMPTRRPIARGSPIVIRSRIQCTSIRNARGAARDGRCFPA